MKLSKTYGVLLLAPLLLAFVLGAWTSNISINNKASDDVRNIIERYTHFMSGPVKDVESFLMIAQKPKYAQYALTNTLAMALTDIYYPELSPMIYHNAIQKLNNEELRAFVFMDGERILEEDRAKFNPSDYPVELSASMARGFQMRPIIELNKDETKNLVECRDHVSSEGVDPRTEWQTWLGLDYKDVDPCQAL